MQVTTIRELQTVLLGSAKSYCLYSFDLFDTLLGRRVEPPELVHRTVAERISEHLESQVSPEHILQLRSQVEHKLRQQAAAQRCDFECSYPDIVSGLVQALTGGSDPDLVDWISNVEMEIEKACLFVKPGIKTILQELNARDKKVVIASDMYLPREHIVALLEAKGISSCIDAVFVSSQSFRCKYSGKLFADIMAFFQAEPTQIVHCGDNKISDYSVPRSLGIDAVYLREKKDLKRREMLKKYYYLGNSSAFWKGRYCMQAIGSLPAKQNAKYQDFFYRYGYEVLGFIFCSYMQGLIQQVQEKEIKTVYFLARDGFLLQKLFDRFATEYDASLRRVTTRYACLTRQSTAPASLIHGMSHFKALLPLYNPKQRGLLSILHAYNLSPHDFSKAAARHGFTRLDTPIHNWSDPRLMAFLDDGEVQSKIQAVAWTYWEDLYAYLEQLGFFQNDRVGLCDIGWNATIQYFLGSAFAHERQYPVVEGLYFAYCRGIPYTFTDKDHIVGIFYDEARQLETERVILSFEELFEESCRAMHATTVGYRRRGHKVMPRFKDSSKTDRKAEQSNNKIIRQMQKGILDFSQEFLSTIQSTNMGFADTKHFATALAERVVAYPRREEVNRLQELVHTEDWGYDNILLIGCKKPTSWKNLKKCLLESNWKYGTAAQMIGGIILPFLRCWRIMSNNRL